MIGQAGQAAPPGTPPTSLAVFWSILGRIVAKLCADHTYGQVVITLKAGVPMDVHIQTTYHADKLPRI